MPAAKPKIAVICRQCGTVIYRPPCLADRPFCGRQCMAAYYSAHPHVLLSRTENRYKSGPAHHSYNSVVVLCENCGKSFERKKSQVERSEHLFCGRTCRIEWYRKNPVTYADHSPNTTCAQCGKLLFRQPNQIERSTYQFCGKNCHGLWDAAHKVGEQSGNWRGGPVTTPCAWCGASVIRPVAWANRKGRNGIGFCSDQCKSLYWSQTYSGSAAPNWQGGIRVPNYGDNWMRQRRRTRERDHNTCQRCGITADKLGFAMDVHHIRPFKSFLTEHDSLDAAAHIANRLENLICYCRSCHLSVERNGIAISHASS